jgi:hypothetical protein
MNHISKADFVDTIFDQIPSNASNDFAEKVILGFLIDLVPSGKLYKYRPVNKNSLSNLRNGTLFCAVPSSFNDPFDCQIGLDISSYFAEIFNQELSPIESYLDKFKKVYCGKIQISDCSEHEQLVFTSWQNSKNLMPFLQQCLSNPVDLYNLGIIFLENFNIVAELMLPLLSNEQLRAQMTSSLKLFPGLLRRMTPEGKLLVAQENATYEDFARSLGINDDADEITLTRLIYQTQQPDDPSAAIKLDIDLAQASTEMKAVMDQSYRVGCLCTEYKNRLMWSHYADGHKGFCIEYDFSAPWEGDSKALLLPVVYSSERPMFPWSVILAADKDSDIVKAAGAKAMMRSLVTKDDAWQYEDEWRIITPQSAGEPNVKMPPISCIYIGALCPQEHKAELVEIAKTQNIPIKQMTIDRGCYTLHTSDIE